MAVGAAVGGGAAARAVGARQRGRRRLGRVGRHDVGVGEGVGSGVGTGVGSSVGAGVGAGVGGAVSIAPRTAAGQRRRGRDGGQDHAAVGQHEADRQQEGGHEDRQGAGRRRGHADGWSSRGVRTGLVGATSSATAEIARAVDVAARQADELLLAERLRARARAAPRSGWPGRAPRSAARAVRRRRSTRRNGQTRGFGHTVGVARRAGWRVRSRARRRGGTDRIRGGSPVAGSSCTQPSVCPRGWNGAESSTFRVLP